MDKYPLKKFPVVGVCGLNCGLCPRHFTEGQSRCPGCCGPGFWEVYPGGCGFITCGARQRGLEVCAPCEDFSQCERVARLINPTNGEDSFISYKPIVANFAFIQKNGIEEFARLEMEKQGFLKHLIDNYNDGRSKSFYCTSCQLLPLNKLKEALANAEARISKDTDIKEKARIVRAEISRLADRLNTDLKLRK